MRVSKIQLRIWLKPLVFVVLLGLFLWWGLPLITRDDFKSQVESLGVWGPLAIIIYIAASHVAAPLAGTPAVLVGFALYGVWVGVALLYLGSMLSGIICFSISRWYGRKLVERLVGSEQISEIDQMTQLVGRKLLVVLRLFGAPIFEIISYAAGLTSISFRDYLVITIVASIPPNLVSAWLFRQADFSSPQAHIVWLGMIIASALIVSIWLAKLVFARKK